MHKDGRCNLTKIMDRLSLKSAVRIEPLEARVAPAAVVAVTYTDVDGDLVKVSVSHGSLTLGNLTLVNSGLGQQLTMLDLSNSAFAGAAVTITVSKTAKGTGDGLVNVGEIFAGTNDLGDVTVKGDLGMIFAGSGSSTVPAVKSLQVNSIGAFGVTTGASSLQSGITGDLGALKVTGNLAMESSM